MIERALSLIEEHGSAITDQSKYLRENDWSFSVSRKERIENHKLHLKLLDGFITKLKFIEKEAGSDFKKNKKILTFSKKLVASVKNHITRVNKYLKVERWQDYKDKEEYKDSPEDLANDIADEIEFQETVLKLMLKKKSEILAIDLNEEEKKDVLIKTQGTVVFSLPQRESLEELYPEIQEYIDRKKKR